MRLEDWPLLEASCICFEGFVEGFVEGVVECVVEGVLKVLSTA